MSRVIAAFSQFFDGEGEPLANGFLRFLERDTNNTNKNTYADADQTIPNANPLQLDAEGRCPNAFGQGIYRVDLYTYNPVTGLPGELIQSFDPVFAEYTSIGASGNFAEWDSGVIYAVGQIVIRNGLYYRSIDAGNIGNDPETAPDHWEEITFLRYWNTNVTYQTDAVVVHNSQLYFSLADSNQGNDPTSSPTWWDSVGSGTVLLNWAEAGTAFQPVISGYNLGSATNLVGTAYITEFGVFPLTPSSDPVNDYDVSNKLYVDTLSAGRMRWIGDWTPATYEANDVVRDDNWTMVANTQTDERPSPQPAGDPEWVRDAFSPPDPTIGSVSDSVLYVGQRYTFSPSFFVRALRAYIPATAVGLHMKVWAIYNPTTDPRFVNVYPGTVIDDSRVGKWVEFPIGTLYVEDSTIIDLIMVLRSPDDEVEFTYEWEYSKTNGDPPSGFIYHQGGSSADQIRVHQEDSGAVDRTSYLDNIGPGSKIYMDSTGVGWDVLEASKTGNVYTFIVDPGARSENGVSDFLFTYYGDAPIGYVYNTDLYVADARISGYFGDTYDPDNATYLNDNGYGIDIEIQNVLSSTDWDIVTQPPGSLSGGSSGVIEFNPDPPTDLTGSGLTVTKTVDTNSAGFGAALFLASDGNYDEANATDDTLMPCSALALETGVGDVMVMKQGYVRDDTWTWTPGGNIYVDTTTGGLTQTAPTADGNIVQVVGTAESATVIYFDPDATLLEKTNWLDIYHDGTNGHIEGSDGIFFLGTTTATNLVFTSNDTTRWYISGTTGDFIPAAANTYDLGSSVIEIANIYQGDNGYHYLGNDQDMYLFYSGTYGFLESTNGNLYVGTTSTDQLVLKTNDTGRWYIDGSTGDLLPFAALSYDIGSTALEIANIYQGAGFYHYFGDSQEAGIRYVTSGTQFKMECAAGDISFESGNIIYFSSGSISHWLMNTAGDLIPIQTSQDLGSSSSPVDVIYYNTLSLVSDRRLKFDLDVSLGLDFILELTPRSFITANNLDSGKRSYGLIAQEVVDVLDSYRIPPVEFAGVVYDDEKDIYSLDYTQFIAPIIKAIQELSRKVDRWVE